MRWKITHATYVRVPSVGLQPDAVKRRQPYYSSRVLQCLVLIIMHFHKHHVIKHIKHCWVCWISTGTTNEKHTTRNVPILASEGFEQGLQYLLLISISIDIHGYCGVSLRNIRVYVAHNHAPCFYENMGGGQYC